MNFSLLIPQSLRVHLPRRENANALNKSKDKLQVIAQKTQRSVLAQSPLCFFIF